MKILFVIPSLDFADHIAVAFLSAIAKQGGHSTFFCLLKGDNLSGTVEELKPDIVAYSVNIVGYKKTIEAHKRAREKHDFISIMGGPHPTYFPDTFKESAMDAYCVGEGEYAFRDFLAKAQARESFDDIANLITKNKTNPVRSLIDNLDELPMPDRDLILSNSYLGDTPKKTFYATRGCPFKCAYCCNNYYHMLYKGKGTIARRFSVERIITEMEYVKSRYRMEFVKFGDDLFAMRADAWLEEFAAKYSDRIGKPFNCYLRFDTVDDKLLSLLKKAGCYSVHLSVDSVSRHVRENVLKRQMVNDNLLDNLKKIRSYGINTWVNYMLCIPESTLQDDLDTIALSKQADITYPSYTTADPMERTDLYDYCVERNILDFNAHYGDMSGCLNRSALTCFSEKEKDIRYNIYLLGSLIPKLPYPLDRLAIAMIKVIPPNAVFKKIHYLVYGYYISHRIFKFKVGDWELWKYLKPSFKA
ncbi:B12-binding domain-containing radical SAM protein [Elusimicrobiota bacterium]